MMRNGALENGGGGDVMEERRGRGQKQRRRAPGECLDEMIYVSLAESWRVWLRFSVKRGVTFEHSGD